MADELLFLVCFAFLCVLVSCGKVGCFCLSLVLIFFFFFSFFYVRCSVNFKGWPMRFQVPFVFVFCFLVGRLVVFAGFVFLFFLLFYPVCCFVHSKGRSIRFFVVVLSRNLLLFVWNVTILVISYLFILFV